MGKAVSILVVLSVVLLLASVSNAGVSFQGLGDLPGGDLFYSRAEGVSDDGSVVVGTSAGVSNSDEAFRWTPASGMVDLGDSPGGLSNQAFGVSADGSVVVGHFRVPAYRAFRWTSSGGMVGLDSSQSQAFGVSADGLAVVGIYWSGSSSYCEAFRWTSGGGMVGLGDLPGGIVRSFAEDVSADGGVVVGASDSASGKEAYRWTAGTGMIGLGDLPGGGFNSHAYGISADGSVIVGHGASASGTVEAFRWTSASGMVGLGDLPGGAFSSFASDVSADGSVVVGWGTVVGQVQEAFIWDDLSGIRRLQDVLVDDFGLDLTGWTLTRAYGISGDGLTIVGSGTNPSGNTEAWIATIPEPGTVLLLGLGALMLRRKRKKN